jgi:hypothetical protein
VPVERFSHHCLNYSARLICFFNQKQRERALPAGFEITTNSKAVVLINNFGAKLLATVSNNPRRMTSPDYFLTKHLLKPTFQ